MNSNSFFGYSSGSTNTTGGANAFYGTLSGNSNVTGSRNTLIGHNTDVQANNLINATAIGADAAVSQNNSLVLGSINGVNGADSNVNVGIGVTSPSNALQVVDTGGTNGTVRIGSNSAAGAGQARRVLFGDQTFVFVGEEDADDRLVLRGDTGIRIKTNGSVSPNADNTVPLGAPANRWTAVFAVNGTIQTSDARLKKNIHNLSYGLGQLMRLRPVSFDWKDRPNTKTNLGFLAQEVEKVIPEAVVKGDDEKHTLGMNYSELLPVVIRSVQQQQQQISDQLKTIRTQQKTIQLLEKRLKRLEKKN